MSEPRAPKESELPNLIQFLDRHLRPDQKWSITAEYPQVFAPTNSVNLRVITVEDKIVAHAAIKYLLIKNVFGLFKVAAIGSVVTDPEYRNQGLSQKILQNCLDTAHAENSDFAILWTDLYDFYRKLGFELAGNEVSMIIEDDWTETLATGERIIQGAQISPDALLRLYGQHTCTTLRTVEDIRRYLSIPNAKIYSLWDAKNEMLAYTIQGKGIDLDGYIHEWGGNVPALMKLFAHARQERKAPITVILPAHSQNLIRAIQTKNTTQNEGYLGMIRPLRLTNLFFKLKRRANQLGLNDFQASENNGKFTVGTANKTYEVSDLKALTTLLFGPMNQDDIPEELRALLPIPMWIWGWDSV